MNSPQAAAGKTFGERVAALEASVELRGRQLDRIEKSQIKLLLWTITFNVALLGLVATAIGIVLRVK